MEKDPSPNCSWGAVDLCIDPSNHRIMYASTWNVRRTSYSLSSGGDGSAIWKVQIVETHGLIFQGRGSS
ncbi:MAG: hypothetical protein IPL55_07980 [Saprospiraceae bacterium]|nr:hypothetical protein [Saprospiraceae bacterium]